MITPFDKMIDREPVEEINPYDPHRKMSNADKLKLSVWFRRISNAILMCDRPEDELPDVKRKVEGYMAAADNLEAEVFT